MTKSNYQLIKDKIEIRMNSSFILRIIAFLAGIFVLALGVATVIKASLGVPTWDVMHIGLANLTNISIGRWVQIVGITMILLTAFLERKKPATGSVVNILLVGFFLDIILNFMPSCTGLILQYTSLVLGIILMGIGSGMYVASKVGAGPREGMTLLIAERFSISVRLSRTLLEITALTIGWLIGGPIALGTFVSVFLIGPVMQTSLKFWTRQLNKLPDLGQ